jgi:hypothetical protein
LMTRSGAWPMRRKFVWKFELFVLTRFLHANRFPPPGFKSEGMLCSKNAV